MSKNKEKLSKRKFTLSSLFKNGKFIFVFSVVLSFAIWITINLSDTNDLEMTVSNIPIQINLSDEAVDNGLQIFSGNDQTASVTVTGNRVSLGSLSTDDIVVSAQTAGTITTPDRYPLALTARKANNSDNFQIVSNVSPSVITVFVDRMKENTFDITNKIKYNVKEGYHAAVTLSTDKITVSGPQTEVVKISSVGITGRISGELTEDTSLECRVRLYDNSGSVINNSMLTLSEEKITANFSVLPEKEVPVRIFYQNRPSGITVSDYVKYSPDKILISAPQKVLDQVDYLNTVGFDFSTIKNTKGKVELDIELPDKAVNLSDVNTVTAEYDFSSMKTKTFSITSDKITVKSLDSAYSGEIVTDSLDVVVIGSKASLSELSESDITGVIDASEIDETTGSITMPVKISVPSSSSCWAYGEYKANIAITKNE